MRKFFKLLSGVLPSSQDVGFHKGVGFTAVLLLICFGVMYAMRGDEYGAIDYPRSTVASNLQEAQEYEDSTPERLMQYLVSKYAEDEKQRVKDMSKDDILDPLWSMTRTYEFSVQQEDPVPVDLSETILERFEYPLMIYATRECANVPLPELEQVTEADVASSLHKKERARKRYVQRMREYIAENAEDYQNWEHSRQIAYANLVAICLYELHYHGAEMNNRPESLDEHRATVGVMWTVLANAVGARKSFD